MRIINHVFVAFMASSLLPGCVSVTGKEPLTGQVSRLVNATTISGWSQDRAVAELVTIGRPVVPYLIGHLNDTRPLAKRELSLANTSPDAFEGVRHYSPGTVHDAIAAILNQITGKGFVFVYNGATPKERLDNRVKWVDWCQSEFPSEAGVCHGTQPQ